MTRRLDGGQVGGVPRVPTELAAGMPPAPTEVVPGEPMPDDLGVPSAAGLPGVERAWRSGRLAVPPRRTGRMRQFSGAALTVLLLAAAGAVLYARMHHGPLRVTGVVISRQTPAGCGFVVTGRITTNGSPGMVSYRWVFSPGSGQDQRLEQSVAAGQDAVQVTVDVQGSAAQRVTLQLMDPGHDAASAIVNVRC